MLSAMLVGTTCHLSGFVLSVDCRADDLVWACALGLSGGGTREMCGSIDSGAAASTSWSSGEQRRGRNAIVSHPCSPSA